MSKVLNLHKKAKESNVPFGTVEVTKDTIIPVTQPIRIQTRDLEKFDNIHRPRRKSIKNLLRILVTVVSITATVSLVTAYIVITKMNTTKAVSEQLTKNNSIHEKKMGELENTIKSTAEKTESQNQELKQKFSMLGNQFQDYRKEADELSINQKVLKTAVDDLKTTNKLLLDKTVFLSDEIKKLKEVTSATKPDLTYEELMK